MRFKISLRWVFYSVPPPPGPFWWSPSFINILRSKQNCCHFADDSFKCIFLNENKWILIKISLKLVPKGLINNIPALVRHRPGDKPLSEPTMVRLPTHTCVTRPQWVNEINPCLAKPPIEIQWRFNLTWASFYSKIGHKCSTFACSGGCDNNT